MFVVKYHIAIMSGYIPAVPALWQFIGSCGRFRHEAPGVGLFMEQIESPSSALRVIQYMAILVRKDPTGEYGLPRLSVTRCQDLAARLLPTPEVEKLKELVERKILNPKRGAFVDFDVFLQILLDLLADVHHAQRQRMMFQFKELEAHGVVDWPTFSDFVARFAPYFSSQLVCDLFLEAIRASLPGVSLTAAAFQLLVDKGAFEDLRVNLGGEFDVANPDETASFVNMRWVADVQTPVSEAIAELKAERMAECHKCYSILSRISEHMKVPTAREDAGAGLALLHLAGLVLARYKFIKVARKDSIEAQKEVRKIVDLVWT
jgi:hypothetical protein